MATLYIEEYAAPALVGASGGLNTRLQAPGALLAEQKVAVGAGSLQSAALNASTRYVILTTDTACQWAEGANPTAGANSRFLPANIARPFEVTGGNKIATIQQQ